MGVGRIFSRRGHQGFFQNFSRGRPKVVTFVFSQTELRKQPFFAEIFKIQGGQSRLPPSDAHACYSSSSPCPAYTARVRFLSGVDEHVRPQVGDLHESRAARVALVRLLATVDAHVCLQVGRPIEIRVTERALVRLGGFCSSGERLRPRLLYQ